MDTNCQPEIHALPDGTIIKYVTGNLTTICCAAVMPIHNGLVRLGEHISKPSGNYRKLYFVKTRLCPGCGERTDYIEFPCGENPVAGLFAKVPAEISHDPES